MDVWHESASIEPLALAFCRDGSSGHSPIGEQPICFAMVGQDLATVVLWLS
jgi:hypothetical protein